MSRIYRLMESTKALSLVYKSINSANIYRSKNYEPTVLEFTLRKIASDMTTIRVLIHLVYLENYLATTNNMFQLAVRWVSPIRY